MMEVIDEVFEARDDPGQIQVTAAQRKKLEKTHPLTLNEIANEEGPLVWVLLFPTSKESMHRFLEGKITEKQLLDETEPCKEYQSIYLCSATTLPEARSKGLTKKLTIESIRSIAKDHPIEALYVWSFSEKGKLLAESIAKDCKLQLFHKNKK